MHANINTAHRVMPSTRTKKRIIYIFNVSLRARLCCFQLRTQKAGNKRKKLRWKGSLEIWLGWGSKCQSWVVWLLS